MLISKVVFKSNQIGIQKKNLLSPTQVKHCNTSLMLTILYPSNDLSFLFRFSQLVRIEYVLTLERGFR